MLVAWRLEGAQAPSLRRRCRRCGVERRFVPLPEPRVNAHGRKLEVFLRCRCEVCGATWKVHVSRHRHVSRLTRAAAADERDLRLRGPALTGDGPWTVELELGEPPAVARLDRVLAGALGVSRSRLRALVRAGDVRIDGGHRALTRPVRSGTRVRIAPGVPGSGPKEP